MPLRAVFTIKRVLLVCGRIVRDMDAPKVLFAYIPNDDYVGTASLKKGVPHQFVNTEYIRKDAIVAEIEKLKGQNTFQNKNASLYINGGIYGFDLALEKILSFLRSIEVKEFND